ncbi:MAG: antiterminator LoaP [Anaerolineaceae bacterium]|nr:antiterminator LoaP [Anaerolineaceae bacterium]
MDGWQQTMWYVLWTTTGKEEQTRDMIINRVPPELYSRCTIPYMKKRIFHEGKSRIVKQKLFPSYLFIETDTIRDFAAAVSSLPGFNIVLHTGEIFSPIYPHEEYILTKMMDVDSLIDISEGYLEGDNIIVTAGPLKGFEGMIRKVIRRRGIAILDLNIFNRRTQVRVGLELLDKHN